MAAAGGFPGMGASGTPPLPSGDPVIPHNLIDPATMQQIRNLMGTEQMKVLASQETQAKFEKVVERMLTTLVTKSLENLDKTPAGHDRLSRLAATLAGSGAALGAPAAAAGPLRGQAAAPHTSPPPPIVETHPTPHSLDTSLLAQWNEGRSETMGGIGRRISGAMATAMSQHMPNWHQLDAATDADTIARLNSQGHNVGDGSMVQYDGNGNVQQVVNPSDHNYARTLRHVGRAQYAVGALTRGSEGGNILTGRLGMATGKALSTAGMVMTVAQTVGHQAETQQQKAAFYRAQFGGEGTGFFSARDRFEEWKAGLAGFGTIGGERAREDFRSASALGLRGARRNEATDFSRDMFMKYGMSSGDAFTVVRQALEEGNISLTDYAESIHKVTKAAVNSGRSATEAAQQLIATQHYIAQNVGGGSGSLAAATNLSIATAGMDRQTAIDVGGPQGLAQLAGSRQNIMLGAAVSGQDPMAALFLAGAGGQSFVQQQNRTLTALQGRIVDLFANASGIPADQIRRDAKGVTSRDEQVKIFLRWFGGDASAAGRAGVMLQTLLTQMGLDASTQEKAIAILFTTAGSGFTKGADLSGGIKTSDASKANYKKGDTSGNEISYLMATRGISKDDAQKAVTHGGAGVTSDLEDQYLSMVSKTGSGSASIEALLSGKHNKDLRAYTGVDFDKTKYEVKDSSGKTKTVDLATIMATPEYRAQMAKGEVMVKGKDGKGAESVSKFTGVDTEAGALAGGGGGAAGSGGAQTVHVKFTGWAERVFKIDGPTDAERAGQPGSDGYNPDRTPSYGAR